MEGSEDQKKEDALRLSVREGAVFNVQEGFGTRFVTPFALAVGASSAEIGVLSAVPSLLGSLSQLLTLRVLGVVSRKRIAFLCALAQASMWLVLLGVGFLYTSLGIIAPVALILAYTLLVVLGAFISPAWNSWMKDLITKDLGSYFGRRNGLATITLLASILVAGLILDRVSHISPLIGFSILFAVAFVARSISAFTLRAQYEPPNSYKPQKTNLFHTGGQADEKFSRYILFTSLFLFAISIASPFFTVYTLKELKFSYAAYTLILISSMATTILFTPLWGRFSDRFGNLWVLRITGYTVALVPLLYFGSIFVWHANSGLVLPYLIAVEGFSGFVWSGYALASSNYLFEASVREALPINTVRTNVFNSLGVFVGAIIGGLIIASGFGSMGFSALLWIFLISFIARMIVTIALVNSVREIKPVERFSMEDAVEELRHPQLEEVIRILR